MNEAYGAHAPNLLDRAVIAATSRLPNNWLGLRLAIGLRRIVSMRLGPDGGLDVERWGLRVRLHPRRNGCEKNLLFTPQMYEVPERAALAAEIDRARRPPRDFVFVDVGANVGLFSLFVASYAGNNAKILAIEPAAEALRRLRFNLAANPAIRIRVVPCALGDRAGIVALETPGRDLGGTRTRPHGGSDGADTPSAECRALRSVLEEEGVTAVDALKIDVEGAEDVILMPFFTEAPEGLWPRLLIIEGWRADLFTFLAARGYAIAGRTRQNVMLRRLAD
jgi:FkbM family methyltransferase